MDEFKELCRLCKASVTIEYNPHKDYYQDIGDYLEETGDIEEINSVVLEKIHIMDKLFTIQVYPLTPIGFFKLYHYDVEELVKEALTFVKEEYERH